MIDQVCHPGEDYCAHIVYDRKEGWLSSVVTTNVDYLFYFTNTADHPLGKRDRLWNIQPFLGLQIMRYLWLKVLNAIR